MVVARSVVTSGHFSKNNLGDNNMIRENIGRRSILKGIGAVMGNPLGLFQKAAVVTANELAASVVVNKNITKCTPDMIPEILESYIYGGFNIPVTNGVLEHEGYDSDQIVYLDVNDIGANIAKYFKNDFSMLIGSTAGGEGLYDMNEAFGGVFSKLFTNAANYMGPQDIAREVLEYYQYDVELCLSALQDLGNYSHLMEKMFNFKDLEAFRSAFDYRTRPEDVFKKIQSYFKKRGVDFKESYLNKDQNLNAKEQTAKSGSDANGVDGISDDDWMATTHGGYEPGRSGGYSKDRVFESANIRIIASLITEDPDIFISEA
jgi:hypothetical protein